VKNKQRVRQLSDNKLVTDRGEVRDTDIAAITPGLTVRLLITVGTRPQIIKLASLTRVLSASKVEFGIIHTGQHYDYGLDRVFFEQLALPEPLEHLDVGSGPQGMQTGRMLERLERVYNDLKPGIVLVPGDTNSALAGALAAVKLHIPTGHIEAGLRCSSSFMPEEVNRVLVDHMSQLLFSPTKHAQRNLRREGLADRCVHSGDVMADNIVLFRERIEQASLPLRLKRKRFLYVTAHRAENVDEASRLRRLVTMLSRVASEFDLAVVFPVHPRTLARLRREKLLKQLREGGVKMVQPVPYLTSLKLAREALVVMTDSGGLQKEAFLLGTPCITLRRETEWVETVEAGWNVTVDLSVSRALSRLRRYTDAYPKPVEALRYYGGGRASRIICKAVLRFIRGSAASGR
jgi:UDP-GlcNAc3NAcA epimerase